jgi:hypothetical protein
VPRPVTLLPLAACHIMATIAYNGMPKRLSPPARAFPIWLAIGTSTPYLLPVGLVAHQDAVAPTGHGCARSSLGWVHVLNPTHYTKTLSRQQGMAVLVHRWAGFTYSTQRIPLSRTERATLEASRPGTRCWAVERCGQSNPRPNQYDVIDGINKFIGNNESKMSDQNNSEFAVTLKSGCILPRSACRDRWPKPQ